MDRVRLFWLGSGILLGALALAGILSGDRIRVGTLLVFDRAHDALHAGLALGSFALALAPVGQTRAKRLALGFATFYLTLAVVGMMSANLFGYPARIGLRLHLGSGENLAHLIVGAWGAYVGQN